MGSPSAPAPALSQQWLLHLYAQRGRTFSITHHELPPQQVTSTQQILNKHLKHQQRGSEHTPGAKSYRRKQFPDRLLSFPGDSTVTTPGLRKGPAWAWAVPLPRPRETEARAWWEGRSREPGLPADLTQPTFTSLGRSSSTEGGVALHRTALSQLSAPINADNLLITSHHACATLGSCLLREGGLSQQQGKVLLSGEDEGAWDPLGLGKYSPEARGTTPGSTPPCPQHTPSPGRPDSCPRDY